MKTNRLLMIVVVIIAVVGVNVILTPHQRVEAQECRIVRVHGGDVGWIEDLSVEPTTVFVEKGSCVVWFNRARADEVMVKFEEGKKCKDMTEAPAGFNMDKANNCYVTSWIPFGGTSSLRFIEKGTFDYVIETAKGTKKEGKIIVQ